jgi:NhaA family Na+:H+ antiporter
LRDVRMAALPVAAALGGMIAPALIFLAIAARADPAFERGWAIPMATDIAFAIGALSLLGSRVPAGLRLFLLTLAIVDDLGAIVVIAVFYTSALNGLMFVAALIIWFAMLAMNRFGAKTLWLYWIAAAALWACMLQSGVHATIAGVLAALAIPMRGDKGSPLVAAEHALKPWVQLGVMPLFALTNAGVALAGLDTSIFEHPIALGAGLGLLLGKPLGIVIATLLAAALLRKQPPFSLRALLGVSLIAGIGFTMSLFIGGLAFGEGALAAPVRVGVIGGSLIAALLGLAVLSAGKTGASDPNLAADEDTAEHEGVLEER